MLNLVLSVSLSNTGHWKFNMVPHGKQLSEDLKKRIVALHKDGVSYKKIAKTLKLSCSMVARTIQRFNRTGFTQNRPCHGRPKKLSARAQHHIQRLCFGNRRMSDSSISAEVEWVVGKHVSAQTIRRTLHQGQGQGQGQGLFIPHILNYTGYNQKLNVNQVRSTQWTVQKNKN